jgi:protocatechuate 3,4-dioxygenase beta subunit
MGHGSVENLLDAQHPSRMNIADLGEPGTRIFVRGTIYDKEGKPQPNVKMFLYHTDAAGYYSRPVSNPRQARLHGTLWSDAHGQYAFDTIKPAHYADVNPPPPMHIHVHLEPPGLPDHWVDSYYFEGDPQLRPEDIARARALDRFSNIVRLAPDAREALEGVRDFRIDAALAEGNQLVNGWYRNP